jgi:hypothetical protein
MVSVAVMLAAPTGCSDDYKPKRKFDFANPDEGTHDATVDTMGEGLTKDAEPDGPVVDMAPPDSEPDSPLPDITPNEAAPDTTPAPDSPLPDTATPDGPPPDTKADSPPVTPDTSPPDAPKVG